MAVAVAFGVAWNIVSGWPQAPRGDVNFAWMPLLAIEAAIVGGLLGLLALATRSAAQLLTVSATLWTVAAVPLFVLLPGYGTTEGFPTMSIPLMALCAAISLTPTLIVGLWARSGSLHAPRRR